MFKRYTSIENTYRDEFLDRIKGHGFWKRKYVVQEKAHGANLSYWTTDGISFNSAKRSENLSKDEKFYNHQLLLEKHIDKFANIFKSVKSDFQNVDQLTIFGEVIGGNYPTKDIERNNNAIKVQKGIFYSPDNEFYAFDIQINGEQYLDVNYVNNLFEKNGVLHAKTIFTGDIEECLAYSNMFQSEIPKQLGLPDIIPNNCEGVIIRPVENCYFNNGVRVIMKNKNDKWAENSKHLKSFKKKEPLSEKVKELQAVIKSYVSENRLNNVISKIGEVTIGDFGKVIGSFNRDVIDDFTKDYKEVFSELEKKDQKLITKSIVPISSKLIKTYFKNS